MNLKKPWVHAKEWMMALGGGSGSVSTITPGISLHKILKRAARA
jgi:hypothetical protein